MHIVLLSLGVLNLVAGIGLVASGLPESTLSFGNVLITCGTMAIVGGLILIGLGSVVSHLRRIREVIETHGLTPAMSPTQAMAAAPDLAQAVVAEPARKPAGALRPEVADVAKADGPQSDIIAASVGAAKGSSGEPAGARTEWPRVDAADRLAPNGARSGNPQGETQTAAEGAGPTLAGEVAKPAPAAPTATNPTILKSGVIEGMAYTLYSDGSIEAELAQGMMRFKSIPELRAYMRENPHE